MRESKLLMAGLFTFSFACGQQPTAEDYDDVGASVGALVSDNSGGEAEAASDAVMVAAGQMPGGFTRSGSGVLSGRRGSLDYTFEATCTDAAGAVMDACGELTDGAHLVLHWEGDVDTARYDASLVRDGDWTLSDIQSGTARFDGTGSFDVDSEFMAIYRPVERFFKLDYDASYQGVQIRTSDRAIIGGQITYQIRAERTAQRRATVRERTLDITADVTFTGENTATLVLDGERTYRVDLASGNVESM